MRRIGQLHSWSMPMTVTQGKSAHRRGKAQESGRSQWILGGGMRIELAHESSRWKWPMLGEQHIQIRLEGMER